MADVNDGTFRYADNEREGNLYFLEEENGTHSGEYAMQYFIMDYVGFGSDMLHTKAKTDPKYRI